MTIKEQARREAESRIPDAWTEYPVNGKPDCYYFFCMCPACGWSGSQEQCEYYTLSEEHGCPACKEEATEVDLGHDVIAAARFHYATAAEHYLTQLAERDKVIEGLRAALRSLLIMSAQTVIAGEELLEDYEASMGAEEPEGAISMQRLTKAWKKASNASSDALTRYKDLL